jgi:hypothetical protein
VQAAIGLRMSILYSLLPIIYADREADHRQNLRYMLAEALVPLAASLLVYSSARSHSALLGLSSIHTAFSSMCVLSGSMYEMCL